ncbi:LysR substrate-binding domain-containing protein [Luteimonas sp. SDU101]|uniref:LysR substrate-binding domain-containing protein n=1 Tax=Luteimonas sp. SDU101 TaxID=3422593 RepID=UPI003EBE81A7
MSRPPLHALQGFVAAARHGNLTRAAESLHLTVSALSHQMRALEERLGYALLVRGARGVTPTADGQRLLERIAPHLDAIAEALHPYAARRGQVLTISLLPSMASAWLLPRLGSFLAAHPAIEINLQSQTVVVDFERSPEVDAALRVGRGQWPGTVAEHLFDDELAPMASPDLVARMGGIDARPLPEWPLLGDSDGQWNRWFAQTGEPAPARYVAMLDDTEAHHRAAAAGVGVALGRMTRARLLLEAGQLVLLSPRRLRTANGHWLVYPERSRQHPGFALFRHWLLEQAAGDARAAGSPAG